MNIHDLDGFTEWVKGAVELVGKTLPPDGDWLPVGFLISPDHKLNILALKDVEPSAFPAVFSKVGQHARPVMAAMVLSAWAVEKDWTELQLAEAKDAGWQPSLDTDRTELLMVGLGDATHEVWWRAPIVRDPDAVKVGEWEQESVTSGRQVGALMRACSVWLDSGPSVSN